MSRLPAVFWLDIAVKAAALIGLLLFAVARPDLPQFEGKAMAGRALTAAVVTAALVRGRLGAARSSPATSGSR